MSTPTMNKEKIETIERSNTDSVRWVSGLVVLFVGLFTLFSVAFYFAYWREDWSILNGVGAENPAFDDTITNPCGRYGAWIAEMLVGRSFGIAGVLIPIIIVIIGIKILKRQPALINHTVLNLLLVLIFGTLTLGFAFDTRWALFGSGVGGDFGIVLSRIITRHIGAVGNIIMLVCGWILTGVFINRNFINTVNSAGNAIVGNSGKIIDKFTRKATPAEQNATQQDEEPTNEEPSDEPMPSDEPSQTEVEAEQKEAATTAKEQDDSPFLELDADGTPSPIDILRNELSYEDEYQGETDEDGLVVIDPHRIASKSRLGSKSAPSGVVVTVESNKAKVLDENEITTEAYDPLKDLISYKKPAVGLLEDYISESEVTDDEIFENKSKIEDTLKNFGIPIRQIKATVGPTVTLYEIVQEQGVKISKIQGLENDIAQSLKALGIRIIAPIPGKGTIGIEVPNRSKEVVSMYSAIRSMKFQESKAELPVVMGRTIQNENYVFDLAKMPHLLVAGATGQGKSVGLNAIITSLLYKKHPSQLKFVMIDPKMVEFSLYSKIEKHFLAKMESEEEAIITDPKKAVYTLNSLCIEMDARLELCKAAGARNIAEYNEKFVARRLNPEKGHRYLPYIVVVVDEFADLIMTAREVEGPVMRLAQKARAIGIHLIIATQRPDVKVITGGIKANFPARIAFRVMQMIDSRTIIDQPGANQLIGRGDMLFSKDGELTRVQCALVETKDVERVVNYISKQQSYTAAYNLPDYAPESSGGDSSSGLGSESSAPIKYDSLFADIARDAVSNGQISTSSIQRNYEVGFNRAGRIMTQLEKAGIVGRQEGAKPRNILFYDMPSLEAKLQDLGLF